MAKIGTAHVEIKPVLNEEALGQLGEVIEKAVEAAVYRAINKPVILNMTNVQVRRT